MAWETMTPEIIIDDENEENLSEDIPTKMQRRRFLTYIDSDSFG